MNRSTLRVVWLACIGLLIQSPLLAQPVDSLLVQGKKMLHAGYSQADVDQIQQARLLFERVSQGNEHQAWAHYYAALADSRLADFSIESDPEEAMVQIDRAVAHLEQAVALEPDLAVAHALLSSVYGKKMAIKPMLGMFLGPKADAAINKAKKLEPENPRVVFTEAMSLYFKPEQWGGDKAKAMQGMQQALELVGQETHENVLAPNWGPDEANAWLGVAYLNQGDKEKARLHFDQALALNPEYNWVKNVLLPQVAAAN